VAPRPQTKRCFDAFSENAQAAIVKNRPSLSETGSIFFRDEEIVMQGHKDSSVIYYHLMAPCKGAIEEWCIDHQGVSTYVKVIVITIWVIIFSTSKDV
jgi:hypothetical protein